MPVSACNTSDQTAASCAQAVSDSIAILEPRRLGLVPSVVGFQLHRPMLFVLFLTAISPTVVLSSRQSVPPFSLRSGRKFLGCSALPRWSSERFAFYSTEQSAEVLRPTKDILAGLDRLARGDLSSRLPHFRLIELQRISETFNTLAANLERTTREKMQLAAKLVDHREQERLDLARDLHDELAQNLSAMSAVAASIKATAEAECPALVPEARNLSQISMAVMRALRTTLRALRPPEIDDFGLAASLAVLARDHEQLAGGRLKISLEINGDLRALPPTAASHVYRIVQEGLTNINKHAHAAQARVDLGFRPEAGDPTTSERRWLTLTIENDGRGAADSGMAAEGNGFGLIGMRERVMALGGQLDILDLGDRGFRLHAMIPFEVPARLVQ